MVIKRYIEESPIEYKEFSSKTVSSEKISKAIAAVQKRIASEAVEKDDTNQSE